MKIWMIGIGPGDEAFLTPQARKAIEESEVIIGYHVYVDLVKNFLREDQETCTTGMKQEIERCELALKYALSGKKVAFVCSGDAGIYGMAGAMIEVAVNHPEVVIEVVPGITAVCSTAALLGAPLIHDFAVISLSDLLTPWEKIKKRVEMAVDADFVISFYNPRSQKRQQHLNEAVEIISKFRNPETPCGFVRNAGREGEFLKICRLDELVAQEIDMFTTIIIGNSQTKCVNGKMVTPRGYKGLEK